MTRGFDSFVKILCLARRIYAKNHIRALYSVEMDANNQIQSITEGSATVKTAGNVFYNPVQEFNRDLSIAVLNTFANVYSKEKQSKNGKQKTDNNSKTSKDINIILSQHDQNPSNFECGKSYEDGLRILEALSATGLRSIRYAKEIAGIKEIIANDISIKAVESINANIKENGVDSLVKGYQNDATILMYQHKRDRFDVIDLDPYGCPSIFLDSAVQAVQEGGLLLVTATDMAVLAGNSPETCYNKYGAVSLRIKCCHEMGLRILLQCIESHANRYSRYIVPILSISADFYIRVFVRVYTGAAKCKHTTSKLAMVYHCTGCDSFTLQPLGVTLTSEKNQPKFKLPAAPPVGEKCQHCESSHRMGGPIWTGPLHSPAFVQEVLDTASTNLGTYKRIQGVLTMILEELQDVPLYYTLEKLSSTLHVENPPMPVIRSAILNAGYRVSYSHMNKTSIKTDAPSHVMWNIMRCWAQLHPVSQKRLDQNAVARNILSKNVKEDLSFDLHPDCNPESKRKGLIRFQENPLPYWGPGTRSTANVGDGKMDKSKKKQGKRKRKRSNESEELKSECKE